MLTVSAVAIAILVAGIWMSAKTPRPAQARTEPELPLTTVYFYGPVTVGPRQAVRMCGNNLFGDDSVLVNGALINAADGSVLVGRTISLSPRGGECLQFAAAGAGLDVIGLLWSGAGGWESNWSSARVSAPLASTQLIDPATNSVIAIINMPGKLTVETSRLPSMQR